MDQRFGRAVLTGLVVSLGSVLVVDEGALAQERAPLLIEGKSALYQRVLTRPGAKLQSEPTPQAVDDAPSIAPFSIYYVYDRKVIQDQGWVEVGPKSRGGTLGWLPTDDTIDWKQTMTAVFTPRVGRDRALFFRGDDDLIDLLESELMLPEIEEQRAAIKAGDVPDDFPVIAMEPANHVDFSEQFYLLPILSAEEVWLDSGFTARVLEIASVPETEGDEEDLSDPDVLKNAVDDVPTESNDIKDFSAAIVFVIDTTISMEPYIEETREIVRSIYDKFAEIDGLLSEVSFALVGFRDEIGERPELEYISKVFSNFTEGQYTEEFLSLVQHTEEAKSSSRGFVEDSYAGLMTAFEELSWSDDYGYRLIILITDAGPRRSNDPYSSTGLDAEQLHSYARDKGIGIWPVHLLTPEGRNNHQIAEAQYRPLSELEGEQLYTPIETGSEASFAAGVGALSRRVVASVQNAQAGFVEQEPPSAEEVAATADDKEIAEIERKAQHVGRVMQLAWLGKKTEAQAPRLFRAWLVDRDLENPDVPTVDVRVFLTKDQLSDLQQTLKAVLEAGEGAQQGSLDFFNQIRSAAAAMGRDPTVVGREEAKDLVGLGLMGEYLEGLPYESKVMAIDEDFWDELSIGDQQNFIDEIKAKIKLYETYHDDTDRWLVLGDAQIEPGDTVYPVPLDDLP